MAERDAADKAMLLRIVVLLGGPALIIGAATLFFAARRFHLPGYVLVTLSLLLIPATWGLILLVELVTARTSHGVITALHAANAEAPQTGFSRQEALVAQGRLEEAAVAYRLHLAEHPADVIALVALGRLLGGPLGDTEGAAAAYRTARQSAPTGNWDRIISNDLIDLYQRTEQVGRLQVELARFGERFRGTVAGDGALARLRELKQRTE